MKLISLNTWGGKIYQPLIAFIKKHSPDTDIFCFQEIYSTTSATNQSTDIRANLSNELIKILPDFRFFYSPEISGFDSIPNRVDFNLTVGKAIFLRNNIKANSPNDILLYGDRTEKFLKKDFSNIPITLQSIDFTANKLPRAESPRFSPFKFTRNKKTLAKIYTYPAEACNHLTAEPRFKKAEFSCDYKKQFTLINFHGMSFPGTKLDTKLRLEHAVKIKDFLKSKKGEKIVVGDFNLLPETQSIKIIGDGMKDLIKKFKIQRTRSKLSPFYGKMDFQKFADYTFVSKGIDVKSFEVPKVEISDHLPMILEFS